MTKYILNHEVRPALYFKTMSELMQMAREQLCAIEDLDDDVVAATIEEIELEYDDER